MRPTEQLYETATAPERLADHARREAARSQARGRDGLAPGVFAMSSTQWASRLSMELRDGTYRFVTYRQVLVSKGPGRSPREISVPSVRDRPALKALALYLAQAAPMARPKQSQAVVRDLISAVRSGAYRHFVRIDVKDFYPSISHDALFRALDRHVEHNAAVLVLKRAVTTATLRDGSHRRVRPAAQGVPQGLSISNALAELVMLELDQQMTQVRDTASFRFVDDILVLSARKQNRKIFKEVSAILSNAGLVCHSLQAESSKTTWGSLSAPVDYLGYSISDSVVSVRGESVTRLKERISRHFARYRAKLKRKPSGDDVDSWRSQCHSQLAWYLDLTIAGCVLDGHRRGWIHYFALIDDIALLRGLDFFVMRKSAEHAPSLVPKSFVRAYRRAIGFRSDRGTYVPDFDAYDDTQRRGVLNSIFGISVDTLSVEQVEAEFYRRLRRELDYLETDLALAY